jgi:hypothetical protein
MVVQRGLLVNVACMLFAMSHLGHKAPFKRLGSDFVNNRSKTAASRLRVRCEYHGGGLTAIFKLRFTDIG